jgi:hypothetical protein
MTASLKQNLIETLKLQPAAVDWLMMLWNAIQVFDDVADGHKVDRKSLNSAIWDTLVAMGQNPFYAQNAAVLAPCLACSILKWQASDQAERSGRADARSFVWRASFYDVVLMVFQLCHGPALGTENAHLVMQLYGENLADYLKEFEDA